MFDDFEIIYRYTRRQAIEDGVLVDVTYTAKEAGFRYPVALTNSVWSHYVKIPEGVQYQDETGRLWDILHLLLYAIASSADTDIILFQLQVRNDNTRPELVTLKAICHADDDASPCITVMLPDED